MLLEQVEHTIISEASFPIEMKAVGEGFHDLRLDCDMQVRGRITVFVRKERNLDGSHTWRITDDAYTVRHCKNAWNDYYDDIAAICIRNSVQESIGELYTIVDTAPYTSLCCLLCAIIEIRGRVGLV